MLRGILGGFARGRRQTSAATLYLDFLAGLNDSRITYSGGANGTRVNSAGVIVAATTPRFDYDPVTLQPRGLLVEEARTNLALRSGDLSNAAWTSIGALTVTSGSTDPEGGTSGTTLNDTDAAAFCQRYQDIAVANDSTQRVMSYFLKQGTAAASTIQLTYYGGSTVFYNANVDWATKTVTASGGAVAADVSITPWRDGYYRVSVRGANNSTGNTFARMSLLPAGAAGVAATGSCIAYGAQLEPGSFPTSYIPTTSASVTKTADVGAMTGSNFTAFYNQAGGTAVVRFQVITTVAGTRPIISFDDNTANERIELYTSGTDLRYRVVDGGGTQFDMSVGTIVANTTYKAAISFALNNFAACLNGGTVATSGSGALPTPDRLRIGSNQAGNYLNGHEATLEYYPRAMPQQLQALTA